MPLAIFGPHAYGERTGLLGVPARAAKAFAPLCSGYCLMLWGRRPYSYRQAFTWLRSELCLLTRDMIGLHNRLRELIHSRRSASSLGRRE